MLRDKRAWDELRFCNDAQPPKDIARPHTLRFSQARQNETTNRDTRPRKPVSRRQERARRSTYQKKTAKGDVKETAEHEVGARGFGF